VENHVWDLGIALSAAFLGWALLQLATCIERSTTRAKEAMQKLIVLELTVAAMDEKVTQMEDTLEEVETHMRKWV
jgi:hypothetical protein